MKALLSQVQNNPHRDLGRYPIFDSVIAKLVPSIKKTGFWGGLRARPLNNEIHLEDGRVLKDEAEINDYLKTLEFAYDPENNEPLFDIEQAFGHHRKEAALQAGEVDADFAITYIADDIMLQMMAEENHRDAASNIAVWLETVRQVSNTLLNQINSFEDFDDYAEKYDFIDNPKAFKSIKKQGLGYRKIHEFLGESWSIDGVQSADTLLKKIKEGVMEQDQVIYMPSISICYAFSALAEEIRGMEVPDWFKDYYVQEASDFICNLGSTVKIVKGTRARVKKNQIPYWYLHNQSVKKFDLAKEIDRVSIVKNIETVDFLDIEGLQGWDGLEDAVQAAIDAQTKRAEKADADLADAPAEDDGTAVPDTTEEAEAAIADAETEAAEVAELPPLEDVEYDGEPSVAALAATFTTSSNTYALQVERLIGKTEDMDAKSLDQFGVAYEKVFTGMVKVGLETYGKQDLLIMLDTAEKEM